MGILNFKRTYRSLIRLKEIIQVLTKHGFGHFVARLNLVRYVPGLGKLRIFRKKTMTEASMPVRVRYVLQELGPTFVKLGQILSGRPDILPEEYIQEFKLLQDKVPPFPVDQVFSVIENEFARPAQEIFHTFSPHALASGSMGQAHAAELPDRSPVIVKIRRPGIEKTIATDIDILQFFAELIEYYIEELRILQPTRLVKEFAKNMRKELDFTQEASYCEKFGTMLANDPNISCPKVFWDYTTTNVIVLERLEGINIGETEMLRSQGVDLKNLARVLASSFMEQYFVKGMFHGDPHPGNILVTPTGKINLIDFGSVGHLTHDLKNQLSTVIIAIVKKDIRLIVEVYSDIGVFTEMPDKQKVTTDILDLLDRYLGVPLEHLDMRKVFLDVFSLAREHKAILPQDFILLVKSMVTIVAIGRDLDPKFDLMQAASPHLHKIIRQKLSPKHVFNQLFFNFWTLYNLLQALPSDLKELMRRLKTGKLQITIKHEATHRDLIEIDKIFQRLAYSIIAAAFVIGASIMATAGIEPKFKDVSIYAIIGYVIAGLFITMAMFVGPKPMR